MYIITAESLDTLCKFGSKQGMTPRQRFWEKVNKVDDNECWEWTAYTNACGYGAMELSRKSVLAHRVSWVIHRGPIPDKMCILHSCDNPACVNPSHLFMGTRSDNMLDMWEKGRQGDRNVSGSSNPSAKLREGDIVNIREMYRSGKHTIESIARLFPVSPSQIYNIVIYKQWRHVR